MATGGKSFVRSVDKASEEFYDFECSPCSKDGINTEAVKYCDDGCNYVCRKCVKDHAKFPSLANHKILDIAAMSGRGPRQAKFVPTERCESHHGNLIDTYCGDHDEVCCPTCVSLDHRGCTDMKYLLHVAKGIRKTKEYKTITDEIQKVKSRLESLKKAKQDDKSRLERETTTCLNQIRDFRKIINKHFDDLEKTAVDQVHAKHDEYENKLKTDIKALEQTISTLEASIEQMKKANTDNEPQVFVCVKKGKRNQNDGNKLAQEMQDSLRQEKLNFQINKGIKKYISTLKSLGDFPKETRDDKPYTGASLLGKYDVRVKKEKGCCITGSCLLDDNTMLVTDYDNENLKRLNSSYKVIDHVKLHGNPYAVSAAGPGEAAVTLGRQRKIQFVSLGSKMSLTRSINVREYCRGVAYSDGELFVSCGGSYYDCDQGPGQVRTYNTAGQLLRTVQTDAVGQEMFSVPRHIAVSADGTLIHVADKDKGVITLDRQGNKQSQTSDPDLKYAEGICLGDNDQLFLCRWGSKIIIQFNKTGQKLAVLLGESDGVNKPLSVCYDPANNRLIITMEDANNISVYNLRISVL